MRKNRRKRGGRARRRKSRKGRKHEKPISDKNKSIGPSIGMIPNPFADLSEEDRNQLVQQIEENSEETYQNSLTRIREILIKYDPIDLLSILASYGLTVAVGDDGVQAKDSEAEIHQYHIELCQAFALQSNPEDVKKELFGPDVVQELWDSLTGLMQANTYRDIADAGKDGTAEEKAVRHLQQWIRGNTQMVRNWGYFSQVKGISLEIYEYFDALLEKSYGFSASNVIALFLALIKEIETANTERYEMLSMLYHLKDKAALVYKYYEVIGLPVDEADNFLQKIDIQSVSFKSLFSMLMSHSDFRLQENYKISTQYLSDKLKIKEETITKIMEEFSHGWGDLQEYETEYLYLSNPVWFRPIIRIADNNYFCVLPQVFFSFVIPCMDRLVEKIDKNALSQRRADYLEGKIVEIINRRFPESNTVYGVKWKLDGVEYETDLIAFIDSHVIIVEAKSGKISDPALRGAPDRLKKHIEEILIAPNMQSKRLKMRLEELKSDSKLEDELRDKLPVNLNDVHKVLRLSVSLEDFGTIQANVAQLRETGWLPDDFETCPTMNLADFETLIDYLDDPVQIIHYLERRQELEDEIGYMGDELDLMGLYMSTLFNLGDTDADANFIISEMSFPLDAYYNSKDAGIAIPKPKPKISPLFAGIMRQLENRRTPRWTEIGVILNRFSPDDQLKLSRMIVKLKNNVRKNWRKEGHKNIAICVPPKASKYAICYVIFNDKNADRRDEFIREAANYGLEAEHVEQCMVIAENMDRNDASYHFIGLFG